MTATASQKKSHDAGDHESNQLLATAKRAQVLADQAVADLAATKKVLSDAPRMVEFRQAELLQAQESLRIAEEQWNLAQAELAKKQTDAGHLIEMAAAAQQELAKALVNGLDVGELSNIPPVQPTLATLPNSQLAAGARFSQRQDYNTSANAAYSLHQPAQRPSKGSLTRSYGPPPDERLDEIGDYLADRDVLCPSCGVQLRGVSNPQCPECRLALTMPVLRSIRTHGVSLTIWAIRLTAGLAGLISLYIGMMQLMGRNLVGCADPMGSCQFIVKSYWSTMFGLPIALPAGMLFLTAAALTFFVSVGRTDTTRRKAWLAFSATSMLAAGGSTVFLFIQFVILRGFCPLCTFTNALGIVLGGLALLGSPLLRYERVPEEATSAIRFNKKQSGLIFASVAIILLVSTGLQGFTKKKDKAYAQFQQETRQRLLGDQKKKEDNKGLLMGGMNLPISRDGKSLEPENKSTPRKPSTTKSGVNRKTVKAVKPSGDNTTFKKSDGGGLLLPGLSSDKGDKND